MRHVARPRLHLNPTFRHLPRSYACYYLTRNSLTYTAPVMVADPTLGMDITQIGAMTSIFPIAYGEAPAPTPLNPAAHSLPHECPPGLGHRLPTQPRIRLSHRVR